MQYQDQASLNKEIGGEGHLEDRAAECDCEELFHMCCERRTSRYNEPDIASKCLLEGLEDDFVQKRSSLQAKHD